MYLLYIVPALPVVGKICYQYLTGYDFRINLGAMKMEAHQWYYMQEPNAEFLV